MDNPEMYLDLAAMFVQNPIELISNLQEFQYVKLPNSTRRQSHKMK
jgi:hypothetical protein